MDSNLITHQLLHAHARINKYCKVCDQKSKILQCADCCHAVYCSAKCQRADWSEHQTFCSVGAKEDEKKRKREPFQQIEVGGDKNPRLEEIEVVPFGGLPKDVIVMIASFLPKEDFQNFRKVQGWLLNHPGIIRHLQNDYVYEIKNLQQITVTPDTVDWTRRIKKIFYAGQDQEIIDHLPVYFDPTRVTFLNMPFVFQEDLSPIGQFENLEELYLTEFDGLIFFIARLRNLKILDLSGFEGDDISSLTGLDNLRDLKLPFFNGDISPLASLVNLQKLDLGQFQGNDISPLSRLINLQTLQLDEFDGDISPLAELVNLRKLRLPKGHPYAKRRWKEYLASLRNEK